MTHAEIIWTVVVGGGSGRRFGLLKQYETLGDARVIDWSRQVADAASDGVVVVVPADDAEREHGVAGGDSRSVSVRAGLAAVPDEATIICIHDAARPFATLEVFERVIDAVVRGADAAVPGVEVTDTIKVVGRAVSKMVGKVAVNAGSADGEALTTVVDTPDRSTLVAVQTPQAFRAAALRAAHDAGGEATDDAAMIERSGGRVVVVAGAAINRKITVPDDLVWARALVESGGVG